MFISYISWNVGGEYFCAGCYTCRFAISSLAGVAATKATNRAVERIVKNFMFEFLIRKVVILFSI